MNYYKSQQQIQNALLALIKSSLPAHLAAHALFCVAAEKKILLYTDSANWSSQLRFYHRQILHKLTISNRGRFVAVKIKIIPLSVAPKVQIVTLPSKENISLIANQAKVQTDTTLKIALLNLVATLNKQLQKESLT